MTQIELPYDGLTVIERRAVRLVVQDPDGRVLLFRTRDSTNPAAGVWWELPGGGIDGEETYFEAAIRELREEAGIRVLPTQVRPTNWRRTATFQYRGRRNLQHEVVVLVVLDEAIVVDGGERLDYEVEDYFDLRWWSPEEVQAAEERFYPGRLPSLLRPFLAGEQIDEPFELWS